MGSYLKKYYDILGLPTSATQKDIKKAYFKLAKEYHPDVNPTPEAKKRFIEINKAYEFLSDPQKIRNILYKYAAPKKAKQRRTQRRETKVRKKTTRRASANTREFQRIVNRDTMINDFRYIGKKMLIFHVGVDFFIAFSYLVNSHDETPKYSLSEFISALIVLTIGVTIIGGIFFLMVYIDYVKNKTTSS